MTKRTKDICVGIIIDTDLKIPPLTGVSFRLYYLSKELVKQGVCVKIFLCNRGFNKDMDLKILYNNSGIEYHIIPESIFYNQQIMLKIISKEHLDIIQFEDSIATLYFSKIFKILKIPVLVEIHDVEMTLKETLGCSKEEILFSRKSTRLACKLAETVVCMTKKDQNELVLHEVNKNKIHIVPNPISSEYLKFFGPQTKKLNIIFIGNMFYQPNQLAVKNICTKIQPMLIKNFPLAKFYFIGMHPKKLKEQLANARIIFTGPVSDLNKYLKKGTIALCPVMAGSGMKVKILNYAAVGLPIITTSIGASGYESLKHLIVEDDLGKYTDIITRLFKDKEKLKDNASSLYNEVVTYFSVEIIGKKMVKIYKQTEKRENTTINRIRVKNISKKLFWLNEKRIKKVNNNYYYIIKNEKIIHKEKYA